jgi:hypothetical protein
VDDGQKSEPWPFDKTRQEDTGTGQDDNNNDNGSSSLSKALSRLYYGTVLRDLLWRPSQGRPFKYP